VELSFRRHVFRKEQRTAALGEKIISTQFFMQGSEIMLQNTTPQVLQGTLASFKPATEERRNRTTS
jgi:hypothetical protein